MLKSLKPLFIAAALVTSAWALPPTLSRADDSATTKPAATQAAMPACCGDACNKMGGGFCKADDKSKVTCAMGGSCCVKPDDKKTEGKKGSDDGTGGMNMGK